MAIIRKFEYWPKHNGNIIGTGISNGTLAGGTASADFQPDNIYMSLATAATTGSRAEWNGQTLQNGISNDVDWTCEWRVRTGASISDIRLYVGFTTSVPLANSDSISGAAVRLMAFRYSAATDPGWVGVLWGGSAQTTTTQVAAIAANTSYVLKIRFVSTGTPTVHFSVDGGTEVSATANIPAPGTDMMVESILYTTTAASRSVSFSKAICSYGVDA